MPSLKGYIVGKECNRSNIIQWRHDNAVILKLSACTAAPTFSTHVVEQ